MKPCPGDREPAAPALEAGQPRPGRGRGRRPSLVVPASERPFHIFHPLLGTHSDLQTPVFMAGDFWEAAMPSFFVALLLAAAIWRPRQPCCRRRPRW